MGIVLIIFVLVALIGLIINSSRPYHPGHRYYDPDRYRQPTRIVHNHHYSGRRNPDYYEEDWEEDFDDWQNSNPFPPRRFDDYVFIIVLVVSLFFLLRAWL